MTATERNKIGGPEWNKECLRWRGRVLTGKGRHWCYDWDFLPVDETTPEWEGCTCFPHAIADLTK